MTSWRALALQLFMLPMAIVAACVGIFLLFGSLADEDRDARTLLAEIRRHDGGSVLQVGDRNARWNAARFLPESVVRERESLRQDPSFCRGLIELYEDPRYPDAAIRAVLASAMGQLGDPQAIPVLVRGLSRTAEEERHERFACAWALGALQAREGVPALAALLQDPSSSLRKIAAYALGAIGDPEARRALGTALEDADAPVRWTAAVCLASRGDASGSAVLTFFLDRKAVESSTQILPEERETVLAESARAAGALGTPEFKAALERLSRDPSAKVSLAARQALIAAGKSHR